MTALRFRLRITVDAGYGQGQPHREPLRSRFVGLNWLFPRCPPAGNRNSRHIGRHELPTTIAAAISAPPWQEMLPAGSILSSTGRRRQEPDVPSYSSATTSNSSPLASAR